MKKQQKLTYCFLAGLIDGDGFIRTYKNTGEYTITVHKNDKALLLQLQQQFGGDVREVPNKKAIRYYLNSKNAKEGKTTLIELTKGLNSHIRNSIRVEQFKELCNALGITYEIARPISKTSGYIAGLFSADGSISINCKLTAKDRKEKKEQILLSTGTTKEEQRSLSEKELSKKSIKDLPNFELSAKEKAIQRVLNGVAPLVEIKISSKFLINIENIALALNFGKTRFSKGNNRAPEGYHYFCIIKEEDVIQFVDYMNSYKSNSIKHKRLNLVKELYALKKIRSHLSTAEKKEAALWEKLVRKWFEED